MAIKWSEDLSVHIKEIDDQHKQFIRIMNDLYASYNNVEMEGKLSGVLRQLRTYAEYHFATEERYFDLYSFPDAEDHKKKHRELMERVLKFQERYSDGDWKSVGELFYLVEDWLVNHLMIYDKKYATWFSDHGITIS